jgi:hypothetical protein
MTAASAEWLPVLSSIDQSIDELRDIEEVTKKLRDIVRDVRGVARVVRALPVMVRLGSELVRHRHVEFASTEEVWLVAEALEPHLFELVVRLQGPSGSRATVGTHAEPLAGLREDLSCRLTHARTLLRQLEGASRPHGPARDARKQRAALLKVADKVELAPEIRLVLHQIRLLPAVVLLTSLSKDASATRVIEGALREGLDSMIALLLAVISSPPTAPAPIRDTLPAPMALAEYDARWRRVRASWGSR